MNDIYENKKKKKKKMKQLKHKYLFARQLGILAWVRG